MTFYGYLVDENGNHPSPTELTSTEALSNFIKEHFFDKQLIITNSADEQILLMHNGVDLYQDLDSLGINLAEIMQEIREDASQPLTPNEKKPGWERLYDQIGLSPGEIRMRQRVKRECRLARTVAEVAELVQGTYFDARFYSPDGLWAWGYFDETDFTATVLIKNGKNIWGSSHERVVLPPGGRVRHQESREDVHVFTLLTSPRKEG
jgi:hypothetical protein